MTQFPLTVLLLLGALGAGTVTLRKVWDAASPSPLSVRLPVRVQSAGGAVIRIFAPDASTSWVGSLCGPAPAVNAIPPWADPDTTLGGYHGGCGEVCFSRDGRLAVVVDATIRDDPGPYLRAFDPDVHRFTADLSYRPKDRFWTWALGDSQVACFIAVGRTHVLQTAYRLRLEIVARRAGGLHIEPVWEDASYVEVGSADMNDAGDVAAIVGKPATNLRNGVRALEAWALLIVPSTSPPLLRNLKGVTSESKIAISQSGKWIAVSIYDGRGIRLFDAHSLREVGEDRAGIAGGRHGNTATMTRLAVGDDQAIAAAGLVCAGPGECETRLYFAPPGLGLEEVRTDGSILVDVDLQFFAGHHLFVATAGRPLLAVAGIVGGNGDRYVTAADAAAWVFEY